MTAPRSLDEARRDGHDEETPETFYDYFGERAEFTPVEDERTVEIVSEKLRERYRSVA